MMIKILKDDKNFPAFKHVIKALGKEETRYAINCVKIEQSKLIATDGISLHIAYLQHDYKHGLYNVEMCNSKQIILVESNTDIPFPNWRYIIVKYPKYVKLISEDTSVALSILGYNGVAVNYKRLDNVMGIGTKICFGAAHSPSIRVVRKENNITYVAIIYSLALKFEDIKVINLKEQNYE